MALRDEVKEQRKKLKGQPLKKKLEYYFIIDIHNE